MRKCQHNNLPWNAKERSEGSPQGFPAPARQPQPVSAMSCHPADNFHLFWYYAVIHGCLNLLPGSSGFFDSSPFVQISFSWFYNLEFATSRAEASQLGAPGGCVVLLSLLSCEPNIHYKASHCPAPSDHKSGCSTQVCWPRLPQVLHSCSLGLLSLKEFPEFSCHPWEELKQKATV